MKHTSYRRLFPAFGSETVQWIRLNECLKLVALGLATEQNNVWLGRYYRLKHKSRILTTWDTSYVPYPKGSKPGLRACRISWRYDSYYDMCGKHRGISRKKTDAHRRTRRFVSQHLHTIRCLDAALDMRWNERQQYGLTNYDL